MANEDVRSVHLKIIGQPVAQGRPRFSTWGGVMRAVDPLKSRKWKEEVIRQARQQYKKEPITGAVAVRFVFRMKKPKSIPKYVTKNVKKPDLSNLVKAIEDALNGIAYEDDNQIVEERAYKLYADSEPCVEITIYEAGDFPY